MNRQIAFIAWLLILEAACGAATLAWMSRQAPLPALIWWVFAPLTLAAFAAGLGLLRRLAWARWLALLVIALQIPVLATPALQYSLWIGVHLDIVATLPGSGKVGVNAVALGMLVWWLYCFSTNTGTNAEPSGKLRAPTDPLPQPDA